MLRYCDRLIKLIIVHDIRSQERLVVHASKRILNDIAA